mgnify:CR=1 FL=1
MKSKLVMLGMCLAAMATPLLAQTPGAATGATDWGTPAAYIAMGIASGLCGLGQGKAVASSAEAMQQPRFAKPCPPERVDHLVGEQNLKKPGIKAFTSFVL